jgi:hypothetical protein
MKTIPRFLAALAALAAVSCGLGRQVEETANMADCDYQYRSVTDVKIAGVGISRELSLLEAGRILAPVLIGGTAESLPVSCTVNLDVTNPNSTTAGFSALDYELVVDGIGYTEGSVTRGMSLAPGDAGVMSIPVTFDVAALLKDDRRETTIRLVRNLAAIGGVEGVSGEQPSDLTLNIRPSFNIGGELVPSAVTLPIHFSFGGKE